MFEGSSLSRSTSGSRHQTFAPLAAVIRGDNVLVAHGGQPIRPEQQIFRAGALDGNDPLTRFMIGAGDGVNGGGSHTAGDHHDRTMVADFRRLSQRTDQRVQFVTHLSLAESLRTGAHNHHDHGNGSRLAIEIGDGQRDALAHFVAHHHQELSRLRLARHAWGFHDEFVDFGSQ